MLDGREVDLDVCHDMGVAIFAGEARGRLESVIADVAARDASRRYTTICPPLKRIICICLIGLAVLGTVSVRSLGWHNR